MSHLPAIQYGNKHEKTAIKQYCEDFSEEVVSIGVLVKPLQPYLCASVDGIVIRENKVHQIIEVKCPKTCERKPIYDKEAKAFNVGYLHLVEGKGQLKKTHSYYTQCQMNMYVTGVKLCDFYVWSPISTYLVTVEIDENFLSTLIPKITNFYFNYYLKALTQEKKKDKENLINNSQE